MCTCMCVWIQVHTYMLRCTCGGRRTAFGVSPCLTQVLLLFTAVYTLVVDLRPSMDSLVSIFYLPMESQGYTHAHSHIQLYMGSGVPNSDFPTCPASALPSEPTLQPNTACRYLKGSLLQSRREPRVPGSVFFRVGAIDLT